METPEQMYDTHTHSTKEERNKGKRGNAQGTQHVTNEETDRKLKANAQELTGTVYGKVQGCVRVRLDSVEP